MNMWIQLNMDFTDGTHGTWTQRSQKRPILTDRGIFVSPTLQKHSRAYLHPNIPQNKLSYSPSSLIVSDAQRQRISWRMRAGEGIRLHRRWTLEQRDTEREWDFWSVNVSGVPLLSTVGWKKSPPDFSLSIIQERLQPTVESSSNDVLLLLITGNVEVLNHLPRDLSDYLFAVRLENWYRESSVSRWLV